MDENYKFFRERTATIFNEGSLSCEEGGFIALLSPIIHNAGSILARAEKVILASGEQVFLDFSGNGLIRFSVDGELKDALIEQAGLIEAAQGTVSISMRSVRQVIQDLVNTDSIEIATAIEASGGIIRLTQGSSIAAPQITIEGDNHIFLEGASLDASGEKGGGEILIGGDYQRRGTLRKSILTVVNDETKIFADAKTSGDGGKVVIWSDGTTLFEGTIFARGGSFSGNEGVVETSGKEDLGVFDKAKVDTSAPHGSFGSWLLDPRTVTMAASGGSSTLAQVTAPNCADNNTRTINASLITSTLSNVVICTSHTTIGVININTNFTMANAVTLGFTATNQINIASGVTIRTLGQDLSFTATNNIVCAGPVTLDTTNAGAIPSGANVTFNSPLNGGGATITAGTASVVSFAAAIGSIMPLASALTVTGGSITLGAATNITTTGDLVQLNAPVTLNGTTTINTTSGSAAGAAITFSSNIVGATRTLVLNAGKGGTVSVAGTTTLGTLTLTNAASFAFNGALTVSTALTTAAQPYSIQINSGETITPAVTFSNTENVTIKGGTTFGSGFTHTAGTTSLLNAVTATSGSISLGALTFLTGSTTVTTSGGTFSAAATTLTGSGSVDTTNAGGTPAGANISFTGTVNQSGTLTLRAGITFSLGGAFVDQGTGPTTPLGALTITTTANGSRGNISFTPAITLAGATALSTSGGIAVGNISFASTVDGAFSL